MLPGYHSNDTSISCVVHNENVPRPHPSPHFQAELGTISDKAAAQLAGLAPIARDSGKRQGKRPVRGGREGIRSILFIVAEVVRRNEPDFRDCHRRLSEAGKPKETHPHRSGTKSPCPPRCQSPRCPKPTRTNRLTPQTVAHPAGGRPDARAHPPPGRPGAAAGGTARVRPRPRRAASPRQSRRNRDRPGAPTRRAPAAARPETAAALPSATVPAPRPATGPTAGPTDAGIELLVAEVEAHPRPPPRCSPRNRQARPHAQ